MVLLLFHYEPIPNQIGQMQMHKSPLLFLRLNNSVRISVQTNVVWLTAPCNSFLTSWGKVCLDIYQTGCHHGIAPKIFHVRILNQGSLIDNIQLFLNISSAIMDYSLHQWYVCLHDGWIADKQKCLQWWLMKKLSKNTSIVIVFFSLKPVNLFLLNYIISEKSQPDFMILAAVGCWIWPPGWRGVDGRMAGNFFQSGRHYVRQWEGWRKSALITREIQQAGKELERGRLFFVARVRKVR